MLARLTVGIAIALLAASCTGERSKVTTILGTWRWDVESDRLGREGDFWWEYATATERYLAPMNGAKAAIVLDPPFQRIDAAAARRVALSSEKLPGTRLSVGTVVVFSTRSGKVGKLRVVGYKASHDFTFPEAEQLSRSWKSFAQRRPEIPAYHLQVRWALLE